MLNEQLGELHFLPDCQSIISPCVADWESTLARLGYDDKSIASLLDTKTAEVRALFKGKLEASKSSQL